MSLCYNCNNQLSYNNIYIAYDKKFCSIICRNYIINNYKYNHFCNIIPNQNYNNNNNKYNNIYQKKRIENERKEKEGIENERKEKERIEKERIEKERIEKERIENEIIENDRIENERIENERIENERIEKDKKCKKCMLNVKSVLGIMLMLLLFSK